MATCPDTTKEKKNAHGQKPTLMQQETLQCFLLAHLLFIYLFFLGFSNASLGPPETSAAWLLTVRECGLRTEFLHSNISSLREVISFLCSQMGLIICMQRILNKQHNSKVPGWVTHHLVLCFSPDQGVCCLHYELNVPGWETRVALNVGLWASVQFSPQITYVMLQITTGGVQNSQKRESMVHQAHLVCDQTAPCHDSNYPLIISPLCVIKGRGPPLCPFFTR